MRTRSDRLPRLHLGHEIGPVDLDRARADAEIEGDLLVGLPATSPSSTSRSRFESAASLSSISARSAPLACRRPGAASAALTARQQNFVVERLFQKVDGADLHRLDRQRHVAMAGDDDDRHVDFHFAQSPQQIDAAHSGHAHVGDHAARPSPGAPPGRPRPSVGRHLDAAPCAAGKRATRAAHRRHR